MWPLWVALGLVLLAAALGTAFFLVACLWGKKFDYRDEKVLKNSAYGAHLPELKRGFDAIEAMEWENVTVRSYDGKKLHGLLCGTEEAPGTVIVFHGFRCCPQVDFACQLPLLRSLGLRVLAVDERAHQDSGGKLLTYGVRERRDALCWIEEINRRFGAASPVFLYGISMGSATVQMACGPGLPGNVRGVIADCGYTSPYAELKHYISKWLRLPAGIVMPLMSAAARVIGGFGLKEASSADAMAKNETVPVLFIHGTADSLVPFSMTEENYAACRAPKTLLPVEGAEHALSRFTNPALYDGAVTDFLRGLLNGNAQ